MEKFYTVELYYPVGPMGRQEMMWMNFFSGTPQKSFDTEDEARAALAKIKTRNSTGLGKGWRIVEHKQVVTSRVVLEEGELG